MRASGLRRTTAARACALLLALAACRPGAEEAPPSRAPTPAFPAGAEARAVDPDTSALGVARAVLGGGVRRAIAFEAGGKAYVAAAADIPAGTPDSLLPDGTASPRYAYEALVLERGADGWTARRPGLWADDDTDFARRAEVDGTPEPEWVTPSRTLERNFGVEDVDGDGAPEVFVVSISSGARAYAVEVRAFAPVTGARYDALMWSDIGTGLLDHRETEHSPSAAAPAVRRWLAARADSVVTLWLADQAREP